MSETLKHSGYVAIVGRPNVGKSTFFNRVTRTRDALVSDSPGLTRDRHFGEAQWDDAEFILVDTGGFAGAFRSSAICALQGALGNVSRDSRVLHHRTISDIVHILHRR